MSKKIISIILTVASLCLCVFSFITLPSQVVVQFGFNGEATNSLPKLMALAIPWFIYKYQV